MSAVRHAVLTCTLDGRAPGAEVHRMEKPQTPGRGPNRAVMFVAAPACAWVLLALAACAGDRAGETTGTAASGRGAVAYAPAEHESVRTSQSTWPLPERTVKVLLTVP